VIDDSKKSNSKQAKYVTLNQVNVNIAGGSDKLFVVREMSHRVLLEDILETKHQMNTFT
jgi:hypothetical protein